MPRSWTRRRVLPSLATTALGASMAIGAPLWTTMETAAPLRTAAAGDANAVKMALSRSIPPDPVFLRSGICGVSGPSDSEKCNATILEALDNARKDEPLAPMPDSFDLAAFDRLSPAEQIFAIADIERTARGLPAMAGMTAQLDDVASSAAEHQVDPSVPLPFKITTGGTATTYGSNFAEGTANAMGANYFWMYDDGLGSPNVACTKSDESACWGHRRNVLGDYESPAGCPSGSRVNLLMGVAEVTSEVALSPAIAEIFVNDCGAAPSDMVFTWPDVQRLVFGH